MTRPLFLLSINCVLYPLAMLMTIAGFLMLYIAIVWKKREKIDEKVVTK
ncbi:hypothetical protein KKB40_00340 [Patescibacteria group bacterium]|nr:hypothetical protein [Patescibacteria group bacterium]